MPDSAKYVFTIGHSTRPWDEVLALLRRHEVELLCDVRTAPGSRKHPQYNRADLEVALKEAGIGYVICRDLGGLRRAGEDSPNSGWRNPSFRGYADYMQTAEFKAALDRLVEIAAARRTAIMCAEAVPPLADRGCPGGPKRRDTAYPQPEQGISTPHNALCSRDRPRRHVSARAGASDM